ncbi:hypothetical protein B0H21DRAFT_747474 [Amylocystis lapponica]|nr:hypothetical protein B0H21DRAFT_747474 [Amylocystis lapponica]
MAGKTLSNGTLSLRFMQNAQRAKLEAQVEAEQARVKDDAEWEVSNDIKEAWGIRSTASQPRAVVAHENSYVPFLFSSPSSEDPERASSSTHPPSPPKLRGRRTFDARGQEVVTQEKPLSLAGDERDAAHNADEKSPQKDAKRPTSISGKKTAQMLIREANVVHPPPSLRDMTEQDPLAGATGFVKPAGVDAPAETSRTGRAAAMLKRDREEDTHVGRPSAGISKRKKKAALP